jgi:hypothetical protein
VRVGVEQQGVTDFGHFPAQSGPMEGQVLQLQVAVSIVAEKRQSGAEYHELEFL